MDLAATAGTLDRLADITQRYARYSRSAGGLSSVIGGVLCLLSFVVGALLPLDQTMRYALASAPLIWIGCKELLRRFYYQRSGAVHERIAPRHSRWRRWMTGYLAVVAVVVIGGFIARRGSAAFVWPALGYIAFAASMPLIAWRWFWSIGDFLIGVLMLCQAGVVLAGSHYPPLWIFIALSFSLTAIASGLREHRDYLALRRELAGSGGE